MGVGNYTEEDIKNCALAFTGWTFAQPVPLYPHGFYSPEFLFREEDTRLLREDLPRPHRQL